MQCPRCRHENEPGAKFCEECAAPLGRACAKCGRQLSATAKFCPECAHPTGVIAASSPPERFDRPGSYTPKHLAERILSSKAALEGERKQVTVLFADLKGSMELLADRDPEEARKLLDPVLERMMEAVHRYEGTVNQVMGDGIMALFGAPLAHEDHAVRASYASLRMQESVKRYAEEVQRRTGIPIQIRVGLNSGEVVVRSVGSDLRMDYTAVGQTTHLAARMEQMAMAGSIMMTAESLKFVEGYVQVKPFGPVNVKGLAEPVEVYELTGAGSVRTRLQASVVRGLTRFVGRDAEVEQLRLALDKAGQGQGQVVAVVGEPGVGKSRLFHEFTHSHHSRGWLVLESGGVSYGKASAYLPIIDLLKAYLKIHDHDDHREIRERVTGKLLTLDRTLEATLPAFLSLLDVPIDDAQWQHLDPPQRRQRTLEAVKRLLLRESQVQPLLLLFEDLHWIDTESQDFLDSLIDSLPTARVLLLINYRPEYQHGWGSKTYYRQLRIDPLPPESAEELLRPLLGDNPSLAPLRRLLIERTEGNPLFLEESVRMLVETHALAGERGASGLTRSVEAIQIPASVQAILAARIDRLPSPVKGLLQSAAVIGKDVPFALLQAIAELPEGELRSAVDHLQAAEFLYEIRLFPELEYTFKHALTLEVAYQSLLRERRRTLHERVLAALEALPEGVGSENIELLAHHAVRGEVWDRAGRYLYQAGKKAFANARYRAGATFYEAAVDALDHLGDAADLTLKLDACLDLWSTRMSTGQIADFPQLVEKAEAMARLLDDGARLARVQLQQAQTITLTMMLPGTLESAIDKAREAFDRAGPRDLRTRSYAKYIAGVGCRMLGRISEAVEEFDAGTALFASAGPSGEEAGLVFPIYVSLCDQRSEACATLGDFRQALASATDALQMATAIRHPLSVARANLCLGTVHLLHGDIATAVPFLERSLTISREEAVGFWIRAREYFAYALILLGERERGLEYLARILEQSTVGLIPQWDVGRHEFLTASTYLAAGCPEEARVEILQGLAATIERNARAYRAPLLRLEAHVLWEQASPELATALERLREALELAVELGMRPEVAHCHLGLGKLSRRTSKRQEAQEHFTIAVAMYREMDMTYWLEQAETELRTA
jgi:class 3 adenylate cyclase/tetratricopeptide (TPR) repeat protein